MLSNCDTDLTSVWSRLSYDKCNIAETNSHNNKISDWQLKDGENSDLRNEYYGKANSSIINNIQKLDNIGSLIDNENFLLRKDIVSTLCSNTKNIDVCNNTKFANNKTLVKDINLESITSRLTMPNINIRGLDRWSIHPNTGKQISDFYIPHNYRPVKTMPLIIGIDTKRLAKDEHLKNKNY